MFTRAQLLAEVWDYNFLGGARTVDVHVRRLRAKLGPEDEQLITTVRNVGYKFVRPMSPDNGLNNSTQPTRTPRQSSRPQISTSKPVGVE